MKPSAHFPQWLSALLPDSLHTRPREWSRAALGAATGFLFSTWVCSHLFGLSATVHFSGPLAASAVLLFAVSSGALAQPWSILGSYLCACVVALTVAHFIDHSLAGAALALGLSLLLMGLLRCLHPPGGAMAFCIVFATPASGGPFWQPALVALTAGTGLLAWALLYNNLTRVPYPRARPAAARHATGDPLPSERVGIQAADLDQALDELDGFVDVSREDLELIVRRTEAHALRRSMGGISAGQVMSRDLVHARPETRAAKGLYLLTQHRLKALPILDGDKRLVGIVSLVDLLGTLRSSRFDLRAIIGLKNAQVLGELMTSPVRSVDVDTHVIELVALLSDEGLHGLPVLDNGVLVGMITQTDLVAALHRDLLRACSVSGAS
ncbi:CBS domain-containing membrane protein [Pseudomonas flavescens]|uniref:CBS domain-containing membrane protein n=1 Tax=Phytopseudomonas flavescens TaxID=29435 RepID=A0A1G8H4W6_9GAMM|nr:HPP family protein [Pseudomonas flavescens]SDI01609.1 CBS domain-containing membrane protein [Pseudomonas flavescens]